ncbi:hypothetical protein CL634_09385 [bacterium]|nr:hypothetical protein [bacterium]
MSGCKPEEVASLMRGATSPSLRWELFQIYLNDNFDRLVDRFNSYIFPEPNTGCFLWTGRLNTAKLPYGKFRVAKCEFYAHRVSYLMFIGPFLQRDKICHSCDNTFCVNPNHLWRGSQLDNICDRNKKGRTQKGSNHYCTHLTNDDVRYIRASSKSKKALAREFEVAPATIRGIITWQTWKHL